MRAKLPVLNVGDAADRAARARIAGATPAHLLPSERMRADALAQTLVGAQVDAGAAAHRPVGDDDRERSAAARLRSSAMA